MKKITALSICIMLVITSISFIASAETKNAFEKKDFPFDVRLDIRLKTKNNLTIPIHSHGGVLPSLLFNFIDIRSFSLYELTENPEYLYASIEVGNFHYSEYRSVYMISWCYNGIEYYTCTYTHSEGEYVCPFCGYWGEDYTEYHHTIIEGNILEEDNKITWEIPKNLIGDPNTGAVLQDIQSSTYLIYQKDCGAPRQLRLASDHCEPLFVDDYSYTIQL